MQTQDNMERNMCMAKKISMLALFSAFAIILSYVESFLPVTGIPGVKLGLANFAVVLVMYLLSNREALLINVVRIVLVGSMFGNISGILFSISGAVISFGVMVIFKKTGLFSIIPVAITGGVFHNIGQIIVAALVVDTFNIVIYIPALIVSGIITGFIIGILSQIIYSRTKDIFHNI